jgi:hypothetical protein
VDRQRQRIRETRGELDPPDVRDIDDGPPIRLRVIDTSASVTGTSNCVAS